MNSKIRERLEQVNSFFYFFSWGYFYNAGYLFCNRIKVSLMS
ncbi:hypothetical protein [Clostridium yunnanense]|nr:hypothetical protein [Clostridium yunnanense]